MHPSDTTPVALVTGSAKRIGKQIILQLHANGYRVIIHCNHSLADAQKLAGELNQQRPNSAAVVKANLVDEREIKSLVSQSLQAFNRLDVLVNSASSFYPTPIESATEENWLDLFGSNVKAPYFLSQAFLPELKKRQGCIINMVDIHADKPLANHSLYCMAKAALLMMTKSLACELAPDVRVNGIAPGAILWPPEQSVQLSDTDKHNILQKIPLQKMGSPNDIAQTVLFLLNASYITGQIITVDGGKSLNTTSKA